MVALIANSSSTAHKAYFRFVMSSAVAIARESTGRRQICLKPLFSNNLLTLKNSLPREIVLFSHSSNQLRRWPHGLNRINALTIANLFTTISNSAVAWPALVAAIVSAIVAFWRDRRDYRRQVSYDYLTNDEQRLLP